MDIGIDLGTTFSVIAVKGKVELAPGYEGAEYLEEIDVTILPSTTGNLTIPSVMWWHPDEPENYLFGDEAKQMAEEGKSPIMFSKRSIGTDEKLMLNGRAFTAREVAERFLRHMKEWAETVTGQTVNRAVVTHPAYFKPNQREETLQAARDAGLEVTAKQLMMEPCAAALAYTVNDDRDPLRVMTYDLGGGTFDVAVMEKIEGVIQMRKFHGNPLLGGCNFDNALVQWILDELKAKGKVIPYNENNNDHKGRRARMLQVAEAVKIRLSEQKTDKVPVPVQVDFLIDDKGNRVQFRDRINREQYAALIQDELKETIQCCWSALDGADMRAEDLHAILLVGGSSRGKWVVDAMAKEFGRIVTEPRYPDLGVAAGAALQASAVSSAVSRPFSEPKTDALTVLRNATLIVDVPSISWFSSVDVRGRIHCRCSLSESMRHCVKVWLTIPGNGRLGPQSLDAEGRFAFHNVPLQATDLYHSRITVEVEGQVLLERQFTIECCPLRMLGPRSRTQLELMAKRFANRDFGGAFHSGNHTIGIGLDSVVLVGEQRVGEFRQHLVRPVALKIQGPLANDREVESFYRGPLALQRLWEAMAPFLRSRLVQVFGIGTLQDGAETYGWIASERVWGQSLDRFDRIPITCALDVLVQLCEVLGPAHTLRRPVVHGDLHPGNVILQSDGMIRLLDCGSDSALYLYYLHRAVPTKYVAPELLRMCSDGPARVSPVVYEGILAPSMDVFSLGVTLHRLITGSEPKNNHADLSFLESILPPRDIKSLASCLERCMALQPENRFSNAAELHRVLATILARPEELNEVQHDGG